MTTLLPTDADNKSIPAMRLKSGGAHTIAVTGTSARNTTAFSGSTQVVSVFATGPVYLKFGSSSVTAANTDHYFPEGLYYDFAIGNSKSVQYTHLAVLAAGANCTVYISEKE